MKEANMKYVEKEYLDYHGYDLFIDFLLKETNKESLDAISLIEFIKFNIEYQNKTKWDRFIAVSGLINFTGGVEHVIEIAKKDLGYNIKFIENEANVIGYVYRDIVAINKVEYSKL